VETDGGPAAAPAAAPEAGQDPGPEGGASGGKRVLLPVTFSRVVKDGSVRVNAILAEHFAGVPQTANPDQVTLQEEDRITAYYGGG